MSLPPSVAAALRAHLHVLGAGTGPGSPVAAGPAPFLACVLLLAPPGPGRATAPRTRAVGAVLRLFLWVFARLLGATSTESPPPWRCRLCPLVGPPPRAAAAPHRPAQGGAVPYCETRSRSGGAGTRRPDVQLCRPPPSQGTAGHPCAQGLCQPLKPQHPGPCTQAPAPRPLSSRPSPTARGATPLLGSGWAWEPQFL